MGLGKHCKRWPIIQVENRHAQSGSSSYCRSLMGNWRKEAERFCPQLRQWCYTAKTGTKPPAAWTSTTW
jgi:hypothetical protein